MPNVMAALLNIGGTICSAPQRLADAAAGVPCRNAANIGKARFGCKVNSARGKIPSEGNSPKKCTYGVPAQKTAKHRAKM